MDKLEKLKQELEDIKTSEDLKAVGADVHQAAIQAAEAEIARLEKKNASPPKEKKEKENQDFDFGKAKKEIDARTKSLQFFGVKDTEKYAKMSMELMNDEGDVGDNMKALTNHLETWNEEYALASLDGLIFDLKRSESEKQKKYLPFLEAMRKGYFDKTKGGSKSEPAETTSYLNPAQYEECAKKMKELGVMRRAGKVADLKAQALKTAKTAKERAEINAKNSVQDFTQGENAKTKVAKSFKSILDYAERQRIKTLANNPNDKEKTLYFKNNREMLETAQEKVAKEAQRALERFVVELHKRFEAGEDISKADFVVSINF